MMGGFWLDTISVIHTSIGSLLQGLSLTASISLGTLLLSTLCALGLYTIVLIADNRTATGAVRALVWIVRGVPLVVIIFLSYYGLALAGLELTPYQASIASLTIFFSAGMYEVIRGGFDSVGKSQWEAAYAIGMTKGQALRRVVIPQALRRTVAPWIGEFAGIIKGSTLLALVSISELTLRTREVVERTLLGMQLWTFAALLYFLICFGLSLLGTWLERKTRLVGW